VPVSIDPLGDEPAYVQLAGLLRQRITDGTYKRGQAIPSLTALHTETGLAGGTIQKAVDILEREKLVRAVRGRGTFVK
jgi:DNA-binding GntR family transcriptional regulator